MVSCKKVRNAVNSTVQHSVSSLCFIHPHIGDECIAMGVREITMDLLEIKFTPNLNRLTKEIKLSSEALKEKFVELLDKQGINFDQIEEAYIRFFFNKDHWPSGGYMKVKSENCNIEHAVDWQGIAAEVIHENG